MTYIINPEYLDFKSQKERAYKKVLQLRFPDIYSVSINENNTLQIEFDNPDYKKEEIEAYFLQAMEDFKFVKDQNPNGK